MVPSIPTDASYALCGTPSFDTRPNTDILLGTILKQTRSRPKRPDTRASLNRGQIPYIGDPPRGASHADYLTLHTELLRSVHSSIWAHVDFLPGVGGKFGGEGSKGQEVLIYAEDVDTMYFNPTHAFMVEALRVESVKDQLDDLYHPVVYLVTGIKIAARAIIVVGTRSTSGAEIGPELDLSQFGIPINIGTQYAHKFKNCQTNITVRNEPFVLAYETRKIAVKKDGHKDKLFSNFAVLDDEIGEDLMNDVLDSLDITTVTLDIEADGTDEEKEV